MVQINVFFRKTKFTLSESIYFCYKTPTKQIIVFLRTRPRKKLIWLKSSVSPTFKVGKRDIIYTKVYIEATLGLNPVLSGGNKKLTHA